MESGKTVAKKAGGALWTALERCFEGKLVPETALKNIKDDSQDPDSQVALRKELEKSLTADAELPGAILLACREKL